MPSTNRVITPGLQTFLASLKASPVEKSIAYFIVCVTSLSRRLKQKLIGTDSSKGGRSAILGRVRLQRRS